MNTVIVCLFIAALLPYVSKAPLAYAMHQLGGYDNNNPREQQAKLEGFGARTLAAHQNSFEALLIFAVAAITAIASNNVTSMTENLAITFIIARVAYHVLYLFDLATLRSLVWFVGLLSSLSILWSCIG